LKITVSSEGQIVLPAELRREDNIEAGQVFEVIRERAGEYRLKREDGSRSHGFVDWLLACPAKGFLEPAKFSDTTNSITSRRGMTQ